MASERDVAAVAGVLHRERHQGFPCLDPDDCWETDKATEQAAALLDSPALAGLLARERAAAMRDAADRWTQGAWSDVMLPKPTPPAVPVIAYSNRMGDWLRDRADRETP